MAKKPSTKAKKAKTAPATSVVPSYIKALFDAIEQMVRAANKRHGDALTNNFSVIVTRRVKGTRFETYCCGNSVTVSNAIAAVISEHPELMAKAMMKSMCATDCK